MRRVFDRVMFVVALVVSLSGLAIVGGLLWLRTSSGNEFLRRQVVARFGDSIQGEVRIGRLRGDPLTGVTLEDFAIIGEDGVPFVVADRVQVTYALRPFFDQRVMIERVRLIRPEIILVRYDDGRWNLQRIFARDEPRPPRTTPGWGSHVHVQDIEIVDGIVAVRPGDASSWPLLDWRLNRFIDLDGRLEVALFSRDEDLKRFAARSLSFTMTHPGLRVNRLSGTGALTPDSLGLSEIVIETPGSTIHAEGRVASATDVRDRIAIAVRAPRLSLEEVKRFFPQVRLDGTGTFEGRVAGPATDLVIEIDRARVETGRSTIDLAGRIEDLAAPRLVLEGTVAPLDPADVALFVGAYPIAVPLTGRVRLDGPARAPRVDADVTSSAGALALAGDVDFRGPVAGYDLTASSRALHVGRLLGRPGVDLLMTGAYRIEGRGFGERDLDARVSGTLGPSRIYRWNVAALGTSGTLRGRTFVADTMWVRLPSTLLRGSGTFGLAANGAIRSDIAFETGDLGDLWPPFADFAGRGRGTVRLDGTYRGLDATGEVVAGDVRIQGVAADSFAGAVAFRGVGGPARTLEADGTFHHLVAGPVRADSALVAIDWAGDRMTLTGDLDLVGDGTAQVRAVGDFSGPTAVIALEALDVQTPDLALAMAEGGRLTYSGGRLVAEQFALVENGQTLHLDGVFGTSPTAPIDLAFSADSIDLKDVARLLGKPSGDWDGRATVAGTLRGTRLAPILAARGDVTAGSIRGASFHSVAGSIDYADQLARVDLRVEAPGPDHALILAGTAPMDLALVGGVDRLPDRPVALTIRGENTDLSLISAVIPAIQDAAGPLDVELSITGTAESPRFAGGATLRGGRFTIPASGMTYEEIVGRIGFSNDRIVVEELRGTDGNQGVFTVEGEVAMANLRLGELDLDLTATELDVLNLDRQDVQMNGTVSLTGTTDAPVVAGRVSVDEAIYRLPAQSSKDVINLDEAIIYVDIPGLETPDEAPEPRSASFWVRSRVDLEVQVTDDAILQNQNARIELAGDLSLFKPPGTAMPSLSGTLDVKRGHYEEFGRRFTIEGGQVFFYGGPDFNPGLHVVATRTVEGVPGVGDVNVRITVGGTLRALTIDLSSTPAYDKSEIISIALFGSPSPGAGQEAEFSETVERLALGAATGELTAQLAEELGLDLLEFGQAVDFAGEEAQLFRIGKFLSPDVYVTFEQRFGGSQEVSRVALRYQISDAFTLQVNAGTGSTRTTDTGAAAGIDLFWEYTY